MLKLPQEHTHDKKANGIIARYLNGNILRLVKDVIKNYEDIQEKEARENDPAFCEEVSSYFPENYQNEKMGKIFLGLQALLESEYEFVPELAMEYVIYSLIQARIEIADGLGIETLEPVLEQRDYLIKVMREEYPDIPETSDDGEDIFITWREKLERLEDLHYYETVYFWDTDFMQLDLFTEEQLLTNPVSEFLGIENIGDKSKKFILPPEWLE